MKSSNVSASGNVVVTVNGVVECDPVKGALVSDLGVDPEFENVQRTGGQTLKAGQNCKIGHGSILDTRGPITIGRDVFFGHRVMVLTGGHDVYKFGSARKASKTTRPVTIGDGVWVCSGAILCPGVTIGEHAVIGPGAVVMRNVPPYAVVAGNPAQVVRRLKNRKAGEDDAVWEQAQGQRYEKALVADGSDPV